MSIPAQDSVKENAIENAFARLPRPQKVLDPGKIIVPTRSALLQAAEITKIRNRGQPPLDLFQNPVATVHPSASSPISLLLTKNSPLSTSRLDTMQDDVSKDMAVPSLGPVITLGTLTQNNIKWDLRAQQGRSGIIMVKRMKHAVGLAEQEIVKNLNHHNVAKLVHSSIDTDGSVCLALEYCRYTLAEVLFVHLKLEEQQVQYIARSVFEALSYLGRQGISHNSLDSNSIRITPDLRVVLSGFEQASTHPATTYSKSDLMNLGFVLFDCMEGRPLPAERRTFERVKEQRRANRVFGLTNAERWSGSKQLIDFLDEVFDEERPVKSKFERPHRFVSPKREHHDSLRRYLELVTLECFAQFKPAS